MSNGRLNERAAQGAQAQPSWLGARDEDEAKPSTVLVPLPGILGLYVGVLGFRV